MNSLLFTVVLFNKAKRVLNGLPLEIQKRILAKLTITQEDPFRFFYRLKGRSDYKLRVGDYRIIADINMAERRIEITSIGYRRNIYKH